MDVIRSRELEKENSRWSTVRAQFFTSFIGEQVLLYSWHRKYEQEMDYLIARLLLNNYNVCPCSNAGLGTPGTPQRSFFAQLPILLLSTFRRHHFKTPIGHKNQTYVPACTVWWMVQICSYFCLCVWAAYRWYHNSSCVIDSATEQCMFVIFHFHC